MRAARSGPGSELARVSFPYPYPKLYPYTPLTLTPTLQPAP